MTSLWIQTPYGESWNLNAFRGFTKRLSKGKRTNQDRIEIIGSDLATAAAQVIYTAVDHEEANAVLEHIAMATQGEL